MEQEVSQDLPGNASVITRLCEVLVIGTIRNSMLWRPDLCGGWALALRDRQLGNAIAGIHQAPGKNWTVASLAAKAALSRTVFAERFMGAVGMPPMQYLSHLRMNMAGDMLRRGGRDLEEISCDLGYGSAVSFSRAFKRFWGKSPGSFRRQPEAGRPFGFSNNAAPA